jgi:outer membrane autotransporter protein
LDPYASVEIVNELNNSFTFKKMRYAVGVDYKINKQNTLSVGYLYQRKFANDLNLYAFSIGYSLKLK